MKDLGIVDHDEDYITFRWSDKYLDDQYEEQSRPVHGFGVSAVVSHLGQYHLMGEDDGNWFTNVITTRKTINQLHEFLTDKIINYFEFKDNHKVGYPIGDQFLSREFKHDLFNIKFKDRSNERISPLIIITIDNKEVIFDVYWLNSFIKTLDIE